MDIPGTYSLMAHSAEEEVARNFICFGGADAVIVVCDATCLERNLNLVLQTLEITDRCILCVNLMDEAAKKHITIDLEQISRRLGIPVVGTSARQKKNLNTLLQVLDREMSVQAYYQPTFPGPKSDNLPKTTFPGSQSDNLPKTGSQPWNLPQTGFLPYDFLPAASCSPPSGYPPSTDCLQSTASGAYPPVTYCQAIEDALSILTPAVSKRCKNRINSRWLSLKLLDADTSLLRELNRYLGFPLLEDRSLQAALAQAQTLLGSAGLDADSLRDSIVASLTQTASEICRDAVKSGDPGYQARDRRADRLLTSRLTGYPVMIALLALVFWITIWGANYPSGLLSRLLFGLQDQLSRVLALMGVSAWLNSLLTEGIYRVLAWVVCVMLPPMAIFFPLFTLLEDVGYLPRIAYNLDYHFKKCCSCGKQALTMCMGCGNLHAAFTQNRFFKVSLSAPSIS